MKTLLVASLFAASLLFLQCNRTTYTAADFPEKNYLSFGNGGGYAGAYTAHYVLENGQLFTQNGIAGEKTAIGKIPARKAKKLFKQYQDSLLAVQYNEPGNMYYFLEWAAADTTYKVQWAKGQAEAPAVATNFYQQLGDILPEKE